MSAERQLLRNVIIARHMLQYTFLTWLGPCVYEKWRIHEFDEVVRPGGLCGISTLKNNTAPSSGFNSFPVTSLLLSQMCLGICDMQLFICFVSLESHITVPSPEPWTLLTSVTYSESQQTGTCLFLKKHMQNIKLFNVHALLLNYINIAIIFLRNVCCTTILFIEQVQEGPKCLSWKI